MPGPEPNPDPVQDLVAECVAALERGDDDPVGRVCAASPELEGPVRERLERLRHIGMVGSTPQRDRLESFGPYQIGRRLGVGGMGTVWLAEQTTPVARRVALKVVKLGMDSEEVLRRFEAERSALARLNHPNIAQIFDAGTVPDGRPFFAMELVDGESITTYCDRRELDTARRLELLLPVCDAIQHAHQRGLIHRDLKPSNVLIAERDGAPTPKVIDFGVAKALDHSGLQRTMFTERGRLLGTPEYMSPEQAGEVGGDVDTRTDVYALGVVLYELLTGSLPFESRELRQAGWDEMRRILREVDPPTPSSRISTIGAESATTVANRRTTVSALRRRLRGELDWIALRALAKERDRRYRSVADFGDDLRRHLDGEAVRAAPPSGWYRLRKTVRRNRVAFALAGAIVVGLVVAVAGIGVGLVEARAQTEKARQNLDDALDTVETLLGRASALKLQAVPRATELEVGFRRDALAAYQKLLQRNPGNADLLRRVASAHLRVGQGLWFMGACDEARAELELAYDQLSDLLAEHPDDDSVAEDLGRTCGFLRESYTWSREFELAEEKFDEAIAVFENLSERHPDDPKYLELIATQHDRYGDHKVEIGDLDGELQHLELSMAIREQIFGEWPNVEHERALALSLNGLAVRHARVRGFDRARQLSARTLDIAERHAAADPTDRRNREQLAARLTMSAMLYGPDRRDEAEPKYRRAIEIYDELISEYPNLIALGHPRAQPTHHLAGLLADELGEAPDQLTEVIRLARNGVRLNRQSLEGSPDDLRIKRLHRMLLQLLVLAERASDSPADDLEQLEAELDELPRDSWTDSQLERQRRNFQAYRNRER